MSIKEPDDLAKDFRMVAKGDFIVEFPKKQKLQLKIYHAEVKDN